MTTTTTIPVTRTEGETADAIITIAPDALTFLEVEPADLRQSQVESASVVTNTGIGSI